MAEAVYVQRTFRLEVGTLLSTFELDLYREFVSSGAGSWLNGTDSHVIQYLHVIHPEGQLKKRIKNVAVSGEKSS